VLFHHDRATHLSSYALPVKRVKEEGGGGRRREIMIDGLGR